MKIFRNILFLIFVIIFISFEKGFSQKIVTNDFNSWSAGFKFGMLPFYGDVRQLTYSVNNPYKKTNTGFSLEVNKNLSSVFGAKADFISGGLSGSSPNLNLHFKTNILEYSVSGFVNVNNLISFYPQKEKLLNFYLFAGVGLVDYRSAVFTYDENTFVTGYGWSSDGLKKTKRIAEAVYPIGVSVKYKADPKIDVGLEMSLHLTNTDKLDAWVVKNSYADRYGYAAICVTYKIGSKTEYVDWVNPFQDTTNIFAHNTDEKSIVPATTNSTVTTNNSTATTTTQNNNNSNSSNKKTSVDTVKTVAAPVIVKNYFVVSSAYKTKKLAKEALSKLKNKGFPDAEILDENKSTSYRVAVKSFVTLDEAADKLNSIKKSYPYSKIFEKKSNGEYTEISIKTMNSNNQNNSDTSKNNLVQNATTLNTTKITTTTNQNYSANNNVVANKTSQNSTNNNSNQSATNNIVKTNNNTSNTTTTQNTNTNASNVNTTSVAKKFYIIDASFPSEKEANDAVADLKTKGFSNADVVGKNAAGGYRICYNGYATREEALKDLPSIKQKSNNYSAWIFENTSTNLTNNNSGISTKQTNSNNSTIVNKNTNAIANNINTTSIVKKFYIIAASFPSEKEANDAVAELKTKSFDDAEVVGKNAAGSYRICYKGYATREEALKDLPSIKQKSGNASAWIFEKN